MIKKFFRYTAAHGPKKAIARSFLEVARIIDHNIIPNQFTPSMHPDITSRVHIFSLFREMVQKMDNPRILEIGSRAVTKDSLHDMLGLATPHEYMGMDIHKGPNVDIVGDAHALSSVVPKGHFDIVMSKAVFEHLAMPWKVMLEINKVLKQDGLLFIVSHHTFPLHEKPWDFWRFSEEAWRALLNKPTGFEIIETGMELPCKIIHWSKCQSAFAEEQEAYLNSGVLARKTGPYDINRLKWDVGTRDILESMYPKK